MNSRESLQEEIVKLQRQVDQLEHHYNRLSHRLVEKLIAMGDRFVPLKWVSSVFLRSVFYSLHKLARVKIAKSLVVNASLLYQMRGLSRGFIIGIHLNSIMASGNNEVENLNRLIKSRNYGAKVVWFTETSEQLSSQIKTIPIAHPIEVFALNRMGVIDILLPLERAMTLSSN